MLVACVGKHSHVSITCDMWWQVLHSYKYRDSTVTSEPGGGPGSKEAWEAEDLTLVAWTHVAEGEDYFLCDP